MTDVRSQRLQSYKSTAIGFVNLWTCPAGMVTIVKGVTVHNFSGILCPVQFYLGSPEANVALVLRSFAIDEVQTLTVWQVLNPGDTLIVYAGAVGVLFWISGAVLLGPPPVTPPVPSAIDMPSPLPALTPDSC